MADFDHDELVSTIAKMPGQCRWCNLAITLGEPITRVPDWHALVSLGFSGVWVHSSCIELMEGYDQAMSKDD